LPQDQIFRFQRCSRLEARSQDTENQLEQIGHQDASLRRPPAASTPNRIFGTHSRWKARPLVGRPQIETELRALIRRMSVENPLWGAPRIHGELLKLGFEVAQSSVAKYMVKRWGPPSQGWRTFLRNHAPDIAAMDLFVVPTIGFDLLYAFVIVRLDCRDLISINVNNCSKQLANWSPIPSSRSTRRNP
jgi:hypothetical protein